MSRLIDADALMESLKESADRAKKWYEDCKTYDSAMIDRAEQTIMTFNECGLRIQDAPTVDAVPVKHGRWIYHPDWQADGECEYECSECGMGSEANYPYCMRCGAKMNGDNGKTVESHQRKDGDDNG